eukprot:267492-Chlamydomonas_euryale.AAC.2
MWDTGPNCRAGGAGRVRGWHAVDVAAMCAPRRSAQKALRLPVKEGSCTPRGCMRAPEASGAGAAAAVARTR